MVLLLSDGDGASYASLPPAYGFERRPASEAGSVNAMSSEGQYDDVETTAEATYAQNKVRVPGSNYGIYPPLNSSCDPSSDDARDEDDLSRIGGEIEELE